MRECCAGSDFDRIGVKIRFSASRFSRTDLYKTAFSRRPDHGNDNSNLKSIPTATVPT